MQSTATVVTDQARTHDGSADGAVVYADSPLEGYLRECVPEELVGIVQAMEDGQQDVAVGSSSRAGSRRDSQSSTSSSSSSAGGSDREDRRMSRRRSARRRSSQARQRVRAQGEPSNASSSKPGMTSPGTMRPSSSSAKNDGQSEVLQIQEQINRLLVSYLSSSANATQYGFPDLLSADDQSPISQDGRFSQSVHSDLRQRSGSDVTLNRRSQFILLSLFGMLVAYPHIDQYLPQLPAALALTAHAGILASIWRATPPVLVATGLATIWAGHPAHPATSSKLASVGSAEDIQYDLLQRQLLSLYKEVKQLLQALASYDGQVSQTFRILEVLDNTAGGQYQRVEDVDGLEGSPSAQQVRKSLLSVLTNAEIAAKVALDAVKQYSRGDAAAVVDEEELERLIGMYAAPQQLAAVSPADITARRQSMSPNESFTADLSRRRSILRQSHSPKNTKSPDWNGAEQKRHSFRVQQQQQQQSAWTQNEPLTSPIPVSGAAGPITPLQLRTLAQSSRRSRPSSWAAPPSHLTPTKGGLAYRPESHTASSIAAVLSSAHTSANIPMEANSPLSRIADHRLALASSTPQRHGLRRRQSEHLPSLSTLRPNRATWQRSDMPSQSGNHSPRSHLSLGNMDSPTSAGMRLSRSAGAAPPPQESSDVAADTEEQHILSIAEERAKTLDRIQNLRPASLLRNTSRSRPSSMYELDQFRGGAASSSPTSHRLSLSPVDPIIQADEENRRWSSHSQLLHGSLGSIPALPGRKSRPTSLLLERSPDLGSSGSFASAPLTSTSQPRSHYFHQPLSVQVLAGKRDDETRIRRELLCFLLAIHYPKLPQTKAAQGLERFHHFCGQYAESASDLARVLRAESKALQIALDGEFGKDGAVALAPMSPYAASAHNTPSLQRTASISGLHRRSGGLHIRFPGQWPSSPMIELETATPSPDETISSPFGQQQAPQTHQSQEEIVMNFAPRNPLSAEEASARAVLDEANTASQAALSQVAAKVYHARQELGTYFGKPTSASGVRDVAQLGGIIDRHDSMRGDLDSLYAQWNESRVALRQLQLVMDKKCSTGTGAASPKSGRELLHASTSSSQTPELVGAISASLGKRDSTASTLSTNSGTDGDALATPATSPHTGPDYGHERSSKGRYADITQLLLDQTNPRHLPPPGLEEQLYEAFSGNDEKADSRARLSREERIALARQRRLEETKRSSEAQAQAQPQMELVNELKDVMALLKSRRQVVAEDDQAVSAGAL